MPGIGDVLWGPYSPTPIGLGRNIYRRATGRPTGNILWDTLFPVEQQTVGRQPIGQLAQQASEETMNAVRADVSRQLVQALGRSDIGFAQRGMLRSGTALEARQELEQAASRDIAAESARASLQRLGLVTQYDLAQQQLEAQKQTGEAGMYGQIFESIAPLILTYLFPQAAPVAGSDLLTAQLLQAMLGNTANTGMSPYLGSNQYGRGMLQPF